MLLIVFPYLTALIYLNARGQDMAVRAREAAAMAKNAASHDGAAGPESVPRRSAVKRQNNANCSPARAASIKSSTPVPLATVPTQSMNFASETTGTPISRA